MECLVPEGVGEWAEEEGDYAEWEVGHGRDY